MRDKVIAYLKDGQIKYDTWGQYIWLLGKESNNIVAQLRGWGKIQYIKDSNPEEFQDEIGKFIEEAIKEKLERS